MDSFLRTLIRVSSFVVKEIVETLRQTRLVIALVLGPFLILLLFGIGFRNEPVALRTLFVVPEESQLRDEVERYATSLGPQLVFVGTEASGAVARARLLRDEVDVVVVTPEDPYQTIRRNEQATFVVIHNEIDPQQVAYVQSFGSVYVDALNRLVLQRVIGEGQQESTHIQEDIVSARENAARLRQAVAGDDLDQAREALRDLDRDIRLIETALGAAAPLYLRALDMVDEGGSQYVEDPRALVTEIRQDIDALKDLQPARMEDDVAEIEETEQDLDRLDVLFSEFQRVEPGILIRPFRSELRGVVAVTPSISDYYAPSVIVLLVQHLCVTFGALAIVREQRMGMMELFQVTPLSSAEILMGKYTSYLVVSGVVVAILTVLLVYVLGVPFLGLVWMYAGVIAAVAFTSLGIGFLFSLLSRTISQAVQYSMLFLLASVFFSGFFLSLHLMWLPIRSLSWALPATYGIQMLQDVMLRGLPPELILILAVTGIGVVFCVLAWYLLRRALAEL